MAATTTNQSATNATNEVSNYAVVDGHADLSFLAQEMRDMKLDRKLKISYYSLFLVYFVDLL